MLKLVIVTLLPFAVSASLVFPLDGNDSVPHMLQTPLEKSLLVQDKKSDQVIDKIDNLIDNLNRIRRQVAGLSTSDLDDIHTVVVHNKGNPNSEKIQKILIDEIKRAVDQILPNIEQVKKQIGETVCVADVSPPASYDNYYLKLVGMYLEHIHNLKKQKIEIIDALKSQRICAIEIDRQQETAASILNEYFKGLSTGIVNTQEVYCQGGTGPHGACLVAGSNGHRVSQRKCTRNELFMPRCSQQCSNGHECRRINNEETCCFHHAHDSCTLVEWGVLKPCGDSGMSNPCASTHECLNDFVKNRPLCCQKKAFKLFRPTVHEWQECAAGFRRERITTTDPSFCGATASPIRNDVCPFNSPPCPMSLCPEGASMCKIDWNAYANCCNREYYG